MSERLHLVLLGATGFVGSAIVRRLDALPRTSIAARALVRGDASRLASDAVMSIPGALPEIPRALFPDAPHVVVHFATKQKDDDGRGFDEVNVRGTRALLDALPPSCRGIVYGSSISVYGQGAQDGETEDLPLRPETALATSRVRAERDVLEHAAARGIGAYVLRPRFILGRGDRSTLPSLLATFRRGVAIGTGAQRFTVIDVDDYAEIVLGLARRLASGARSRAALHVGYATDVTLDDVRAALAARFALPRPRLRVPVSPRALRLLSRAPSRRARALATKLELVGLSHRVSVARLACELGDELIHRDPLRALERAVDHFHREASPC